MADKSRPRRDAEMNDGGTKGAKFASLHQNANQILLTPQLRHAAAPVKKEKKFPGGGKFTNGAMGSISSKTPAAGPVRSSR